MNANSKSANELLRERCFAFLIGEMSDSEAKRFESQLSDPEVAAILEQESDLILQLSQADFDAIRTTDLPRGNNAAAR